MRTGGHQGGILREGGGTYGDSRSIGWCVLEEDLVMSSGMGGRCDGGGRGVDMLTLTWWRDKMDRPSYTAQIHLRSSMWAVEAIWQLFVASVLTLCISSLGYLSSCVVGLGWVDHIVPSW